MKGINTMAGSNSTIPNSNGTMFSNPNSIGGLNFGVSVPTNISGTQTINPLNVDWNQYLTNSLFDPSANSTMPVGTNTLGNTTTTTPDWELFSSQGLKDISTGIGAASNLFNIYSGFKGLGLAEDSFNFNKGVTNTNLANQAKLTNEMLATRQATRLRSQGITGAENDAAVADFMSQYGVSGKVGG